MMKIGAVCLLVCLIHTICVSSESLEECTGIKQRCDGILFQFPNVSLQWPYPDSFPTERRQDADRFCRFANQSASCLRELRSRCPDFAEKQQPAVFYGWYTIALNEALTKICGIMNPMPFMAAKMHCDAKTGTRDFTVEVVMGVNLQEFIGNITTEAEAVNAVCRKVQVYLEKMKTGTKAELTTKCGKDVVDVMEESMKKSLTAHPCPNTP